MMLASLAGLRMIPPDVYDAAAVDGAKGWTRFQSVTWPLLLPVLAPVLIIRAILTFNQFYLFYAMQANYPSLTLSTAAFYFLRRDQRLRRAVRSGSRDQHLHGDSAAGLCDLVQQPQTNAGCGSVWMTLYAISITYCIVRIAYRNGRRGKNNEKITWRQQLLYQLGFVLIALFVIVPIWGMVQMALDGSVRAGRWSFASGPKNSPSTFSARYGRRPAQSLSFLGALKNSLIRRRRRSLDRCRLWREHGLCVCPLSLPRSTGGFAGLLLVALLPPVALMTPLYILLSALGLRTRSLG